MCECFLIVAANISSGASPSLSLSLSRSQSADVVWLAGLPSLCLTVTNNKITHWPANFSPVWLTFVLAGWLAQGPDTLQNWHAHRQRTHTRFCLYTKAAAWIHRHRHVCWRIWFVCTGPKFGQHMYGLCGPWHDLRHYLRLDDSVLKKITMTDETINPH